jgi:hypothetical protein
MNNNLSPITAYHHTSSTKLMMVPIQNVHQHGPPQATEPSSTSLVILNLPTTQQEWKEADNILSECLVPSDIFAPSPEINRILCEGIYDLLCQYVWGTTTETC